MTKRIDWPLKGLRMDLADNTWHWVVEKTSYGKPFPAKFMLDTDLAGGGKWRLDHGGDVYASYVFEKYHYLGPIQTITYEKV